MNPKYPVYIISKGRWELRHTSKALEKRHVPYRIVVEPQEYERYAAVIDPRKILTLPFSNLKQGGIPARNWVWDHAVSEGHERHWILDDNIQEFYFLTNNIRHYTTNGTTFVIIEDFANRYENAALCGMQYKMFVPRRQRFPPAILNTRVYSCILINHRVPFRWRGRYNEDTDLSLRCLKAGWCTAVFNAFPCKKRETMKYKGGNTDELYKQADGFDGRLEMAKSLQRQHPDVTTITRKWGRWQHYVDYRPFRANKLRLRPGVVIEPGVNNYGMVLTHRGTPIAAEVD